jgi:hypothetical protein
VTATTARTGADLRPDRTARAGARIAPLLAGSGGMTETQARVAANALVFGYFAALEQWHADGGVRPIATYVEEGLQPLRKIWSNTS